MSLFFFWESNYFTDTTGEIEEIRSEWRIGREKLEIDNKQRRGFVEQDKREVCYSAILVGVDFGKKSEVFAKFEDR